MHIPKVDFVKNLKTFFNQKGQIGSLAAKGSTRNVDLQEERDQKKLAAKNSETNPLTAAFGGNLPGRMDSRSAVQSLLEHLETDPVGGTMWVNEGVKRCHAALVYWNDDASALISPENLYLRLQKMRHIEPGNITLNFWMGICGLLQGTSDLALMHLKFVASSCPDNRHAVLMRAVAVVRISDESRNDEDVSETVLCVRRVLQKDPNDTLANILAFSLGIRTDFSSLYDIFENLTRIKPNSVAVHGFLLALCRTNSFYGKNPENRKRMATIRKRLQFLLSVDPPRQFYPRKLGLLGQSVSPEKIETFIAENFYSVDITSYIFYGNIWKYDDDIILDNVLGLTLGSTVNVQDDPLSVKSAAPTITKRYLGRMPVNTYSPPLNLFILNENE